MIYLLCPKHMMQPSSTILFSTLGKMYWIHVMNKTIVSFYWRSSSIYISLGPHLVIFHRRKILVDSHHQRLEIYLLVFFYNLKKIYSSIYHQINVSWDILILLYYFTSVNWAKLKKIYCLVVWKFLYVNLKIAVNTGVLSVKLFQSRYLLIEQI